MSVKPGVTFSSDTVLKSVGASGVLGLGLFKLKWLGGSDPEILSVGEADDASGEVEEDWGDEVESDL